jgi:hypothetical protein
MVMAGAASGFLPEIPFPVFESVIQEMFPPALPKRISVQAEKKVALPRRGKRISKKRKNLLTFAPNYIILSVCK